MVPRFHHISIRHAIDGFWTAFTTQPNFRIHLLLSFLALIFSAILGVSLLEIGIIFLVISLGLAIELINTSIEFVVDLVTDKYHLLAKFAKDTAAAAMLIYAIGSLCLAAAIFLPKISALLWSSI